MSSLVTYSLLDKYRACPRKCYLRYHEGLVPLERPTHMEDGTAVHSLLEWRYGTGETFDWSAWPDKGEMLQALMTGYTNKVYVQDLVDYEVLAVEKEFRHTLSGVEYGGKIDLLLVSKIDGRLYVCDHKYSGSVPDPLLVRGDLQTFLYATVAQAIYGIELGGVMLNYIKRPYQGKKGVLWGKHFSDPTSYNRIVWRYTEQEMEELFYELEMWTNKYFDSAKTNTWLRNTRECGKFVGYPCEYANVCYRNDKTDYEVQRPHGELSEERGKV